MKSKNTTSDQAEINVFVAVSRLQSRMITSSSCAHARIVASAGKPLDQPIQPRITIREIVAAIACQSAWLPALKRRILKSLFHLAIYSALQEHTEDTLNTQETT